ncbi:hypothetical protein HPB50_022306 [Hyalomma asiaticum]|uniref:Uncharacterized protein n=1 Tax=Hyalomma asiaticum TaxID=266040 RepID=A0ACB7SRW9_HYAAI|nr:hypothetical protein HPB50_022306 [Hyalomma asiaticum]
MPQLPKEDFKIIIRPKGGLDIAKTGPTVVADAILLAASLRQEDQDTDTICPNLQQNIIVASTPKRANADKYVRIKQIKVMEHTYNISAYEAAPHTTCKGVIRGVPLLDGPSTIDSKIVNERNPLALAAKRIGTTTTVIVAFDGLKVPNFVRYGPTLVRCSLYRKQVDICYACGRLGHRADVCPTPGNPICRGCGIPKPDMSHQCTPKCKLCGGEHQTGDKECKQRFQMPYIVRRRRWDRARAAAEMENDEGRSTEPSVKPQPSTAQEYPSLRRPRSTSRSRPGSRGRSRSLSSPRFSSRGPSQPANVDVPTNQAGAVSWASTVKGSQKVTSGSLPEHDNRLDNQNSASTASTREITQLKRENALMKETIQKLMLEIAEIKKKNNGTATQSSQPEASPVRNDDSDDAPASKKRAIATADSDNVATKVKSEVKDMLVAINESIKQLQTTLCAMQGTINSHNERMTKIEAYLDTVVAPAFAGGATTKAGVLYLSFVAAGFCPAKDLASDEESPFTHAPPWAVVTRS